MNNGTIVSFSPRSGNGGSERYTVAGREKHNSLVFYRLVEVGGLFLRRNLLVTR